MDIDLKPELAAAFELIAATTDRIRSTFSDMPHSDRLRHAKELSEFMRAARQAIDPLLFPPLHYRPGLDFNWLKTEAHRQTLTFYTDIWEIVFDEARKIGKPKIRILDVGSGSGIGAQVLGILLKNARGISFEIFANDYSENYEPYARAYFDEITFLVGPVGKINDQFDIVLCSHLVEHFDNPFPFIANLRRLAQHALILYAPFQETPLSNGHLYRFDECDLVKMGARFHKIILSKGWRGGNCFVAVLDGGDAHISHAAPGHESRATPAGEATLPVSGNPVELGSSDPSERLISSVSEVETIRLWRFLATQTRQAHIIAPETVLRRILAQSARPQFSYSTDLHARVASGDNLF